MRARTQYHSGGGADRPTGVLIDTGPGPAHHALAPSSTARDVATLKPDAPPEGEEAAIQAIVDLLTQTVRSAWRPGEVARRDAHPKHHACVEAAFAVPAGVPDALRHGVFAEPRRYSALIRFSNGAPRLQHDGRRDARGMAIKLLGVTPVGAPSATPVTQDFVLSSDPAFFVRDAADYVLFAGAAADPTASAATRALRALRFFVGGRRARELRNVLRCLIKVDNPLGVRYWSQTPYRLGPHAVKYSARPLAPAAAPASRTPPVFLRRVMAAQLDRGDARFEFLVQRFVDERRTPIDDPTVDWDESVAPFEAVAEIHIPPQTVIDPVKLALAENLSFTPWHALPEHAPLGAINRVRRRAYETISALRHELNGVPRVEPGAPADAPDHPLR
jgi:hypothetical protein